MRLSTIFLSGLLVSVALVGCGAASGFTRVPVQEITLSDGTRCAAIIPQSGAVFSCDWSSK